MNVVLDFIDNFIKTSPIRFWIGLSVVLLFVVILGISLVIKKRRREKANLMQLFDAKARQEKPGSNRTEVQINTGVVSKYKRISETSNERDSFHEKQDVNQNSINNDEIVVVNEPTAIYKTATSNIERANVDTLSALKLKSTEKLPDAIKDENASIAGGLFVNYQLYIAESVDNYSVLRIPKKGCIIRSHRFGSTKRRGFKEVAFQNSIQKYFGDDFIVSGNVRLNTGKETRPFEPDIAIINIRGDKNIRIDVEIDEPYAAITRQPTHCMGEDVMRDMYFIDRGWIVIRFSEFQVHTQELECLKYLAFVIHAIDSNYSFSNDLDSPIKLEPEKLWDLVQAQKWEKAKYREHYLNHVFGVIPEKSETIERDFSKQEIIEEQFVIPSSIGIEDKTISIGYNKTNSHPRDERISFYPDCHVYTVDGIPMPSASTIISKFFPEFDSYGKASTLSPANPLYGLPVDEIVAIWKQRGLEAANKGTFLHEQIEKFFLKQSYNETDEFHLFQQFIADHQSIKPYRTEWRIFDTRFNIAGTIDLIASNGTDFEIYDWKRSKKVVDFSGNPIKTDKFGGSGVGILSDIPDTSYNRYCLQQSLYRYMLENNYGIKISRMFLIVLYPDYSKYYKVETPYLKDRVESILEAF